MQLHPLEGWRKFVDWKKRLLSYAGWPGLIKHVLVLLPNYWSMVTWLPPNFCCKLDSLCARFLWGRSEEGKWNHLISWDKLCLPKMEGGLGLRKVQDVNKANLAYSAVKAATSESLWERLVQERYLRTKSLWADKWIRKASDLWKRVIKSWRMVEGQI